MASTPYRITAGLIGLALAAAPLQGWAQSRPQTAEPVPETRQPNQPTGSNDAARDAAVTAGAVALGTALFKAAQARAKAKREAEAAAAAAAAQRQAEADAAKAAPPPVVEPPPQPVAEIEPARPPAPPVRKPPVRKPEPVAEKPTPVPEPKPEPVVETPAPPPAVVAQPEPAAPPVAVAPPTPPVTEAPSNTGLLAGLGLLLMALLAAAGYAARRMLVGPPVPTAVAKVDPGRAEAPVFAFEGPLVAVQIAMAQPVVALTYEEAAE
jgi:hypothetical protein